jgi:hypothetical protein
VDIAKSEGVVDGKLKLMRVTLRGSLPNRDTWLS